MEDAGGWARSLWGHCEVDKSIFERLRTECSMLGVWRESPRLPATDVRSIGSWGGPLPLPPPFPLLYRASVSSGF